MAGWVELVLKGGSISDLGMVGAAEGDLLVAGSGAFAFAALTTGTDGQVLQSGGAAAPLNWGDAALVEGVAEGDLLVAGSTPFTFAVLTTGTVGQVLESGGAGAPLSWGAAGTGDFKADGSVAMTNAIRLKAQAGEGGIDTGDGYIFYDTTAKKVKVYVA